MDKHILGIHVDSNMSIREIANAVGYSYTNIRYWLKKHGLKTNAKIKTQEYKCKCGETDPNKFYGNKYKICGKCHNKYTKQKGKKTKEKAVAYLGGKCKKCGFDKYITALEFHHLNPETKDITFRSMRYWAWKRLKKELDICQLVCANCHRAIHSGEI